MQTKQFIHTQNLSHSLKGKLFTLIETSFKKKLSTKFPSRKLCCAIYSADFSCVGLISQIDTIFYLDKLAVLPEFRGKGLGKALLDDIISLYSPLVWRASFSNPYIENILIFLWKIWL